MDEQILRELEAAAQILLAPPNLVNNEQRLAAETVFMNFRKSKTPYSMCKQILETSRVDYVLFEVAGVVKTALIKDWRYLQDDEKMSLREYLFQYVVERSNSLPPFVRERILQVIAILIKRESIDDLGVALAQLLTQIENLVFSGDHLRQILGCNLMAAIILEFSITSKSSSVGVSWEDHHQAKKRFQNVDLKRIFQFCCRALSGLLNSDEQLSPQATALLKTLLALSESVLSWKFFSLLCFVMLRSPSLEATGEIDPYSPLRGLPSWADVFLDPNLVNMFFTLYWKIRMNPQLAHHGMTCLVQLSSLSGPVVSSRPVRLQFITNYLQNFIKLVTSVQILDREALGISYIMFQIVTHYPNNELISLPNNLASSFFEQFLKITCDFAVGAAQEESMCAEDRLYMEGFDRLMISWVHVLSASDTISEALQKNVCQQIFNTYLNLHIGPPEGSAGSGRELEAEELEENEENDRTRFSGQLEAIGLMGRTVPRHSLPLLAQVLEQRTRNLTELLQKFHQRDVTIADSSSILALFEDINWLVLITGFLITVDGDRDSVTVPIALMKYSIDQRADVETSLRVFGSPHLDIKHVPNGEEHTDHLIRLITAVFRLAQVFKDALQSIEKLSQFLSPEVASSILWFFQRWATSYLLLDEDRFTDLSPVLVSCHGRDSDGGVWASRFLLDHSLAHIEHFHAESTVIEDTVSLLTSLVQNRDKRNALVKNEGLECLIQLPARLPTHVKRAIYQTLAAAGLAVIEGDLDKSYWVRLLQPLQDRFKAFINREDSARSYQEEHVKTELLDILECLIGITKGARASTVHELFSYLSPILAELPHLVHVYHNYQTIVESIITLHWEFAENILTHLTRIEVNRFYNICMELLRTYAKCNKGRLSLETDSLDDTFQDVLLILMLLTDLLVKDLLNHSLPDAEVCGENEQIVTASDVCLNGVFLIMPLMSLELLKYPDLCLKYYKLLHYLADIFPEIVLQLSETYLSKIFFTVEIGMKTFGANIVTPCCNFISALAQHVARSTPEGVAHNPVLLPFLKMTMDFVLSQHISAELIPCSSAALFALICCYRNEYQEMVQQLITSQTDALIAERLARAFTALTEDIPLVPTRQNRMRFTSKFDRFITEVYGFLCIL